MFRQSTVCQSFAANVTGENMLNPLHNLVSLLPGEELRTWVAAAAPGEDRVEAMRRIEFCEECRTPLLDLSRLGLTALPAQIGKLVWLTQLDIAFNRIAKLPEGLGRLVQLKDLWCEGNGISDLPDDLVALRDLHTLDCRDCQFSRLPTVLENLTPKCKTSFARNKNSGHGFGRPVRPKSLSPASRAADHPS